MDGAFPYGRRQIGVDAAASHMEPFKGGHASYKFFGQGIIGKDRRDLFKLLVGLSPPNEANISELMLEREGLLPG